MHPKVNEFGQYLGIFLTVGAGAGGIIGVATGRVGLWIALGAGAGIFVSALLARTSSKDEVP